MKNIYSVAEKERERKRDDSVSGLNEESIGEHGGAWPCLLLSDDTHDVAIGKQIRKLVWTQVLSVGHAAENVCQDPLQRCRDEQTCEQGFLSSHTYQLMHIYEELALSR